MHGLTHPVEKETQNRACGLIWRRNWQTWRAALVMSLLSAALLRADSPLPNWPVTAYSANKRFKIEMVPDGGWGGYWTGTGTAWDLADPENPILLWVVDFYASRVILTDDGKHLIAFGPWASSLDDLAVSFHAEGILLKRYSIRHLIRDTSKLQHSVSHFTWEHYPNFYELSPIQQKLTVNLIDGSFVSFDVTTGLRLTANEAPMLISFGPNPTIGQGESFRAWFEVMDDALPTNLTVRVTSSNPDLISNEQLQWEKSNSPSEWQVSGTHMPGRSGTAVLTVEVTDRDGLTATRSFAVTVLAGPRPIEISGQVQYYEHYRKVPGVRIDLSGSKEGAVITDRDGRFSFAVDAGGDYALVPSKNTDDWPMAGVTTLDVVLIRRHILGVASLGSPYRLIAADVDESSSITTLDLAWIRRRILGLDGTAAAGQWKFVRRFHWFSDSQAPWAYERRETYQRLLYNHTWGGFYAVKLGDVNASWQLPDAAPNE